MKKSFLVFSIVLMFVVCSKNDDIQLSELSDGMYQGYFEYNNRKYYSAISFSGQNYEDLPSGGAIEQKLYFYYTKGNFSVDRKSIQFAPTYKYEGAIPAIYAIIDDWYLEGSFKLNYLKSDSISFEKGAGYNRIVYSLRKIE